MYPEWVLTRHWEWQIKDTVLRTSICYRHYVLTIWYHNILMEHNNGVTKSRCRNNETFSRAHKSVPGLQLSKTRMALVLPSYNIGHRHTRHLFQATILICIIKYYRTLYDGPWTLHLDIKLQKFIQYSL